MKKEQNQIVGRLRTKVYEYGKLISDDTSKNMVVNQGLSAIAKLLGGDNPAVGKPVTKGSVGTSGAAPNAGNTTITGVFYKALSAISYPTINSVRFDYVIQTSEANGTNIQEYGLHNVDNTLYARITKAAVLKHVGIRIECEWTIEFNYIP